MRHSTVVALLLLFFFDAGRADAQGFIIPEMGARTNGMGAAVGRPDELAAIYHNPAALVHLPGTQLGLSFGSVFLDIDVRLAPWWKSSDYISEPVVDGYYPRQQPSVFAAVPFIGGSTQLWTDKLVGAFGVYVPNAAGASFGEDLPSRYHIISALVFSAYFTGAVAYRPWPWLSIGAGISVVYVDISRRSKLYPWLDEKNDYTWLLGKSTEVELAGSDVQPAFSFGIQAWPHRTVSLGFMMLSRHDISLEGPLRLKPGPDAFGTITDSPEFRDNEHRTEVVAPWIFGFGANWDITPWLEVGAEFRFYMNSLIQEQRTIITKGEVLQRFLPDGLVTPKYQKDSFHTGGGFKIHPPLRWIDIDLMTGFHFDNSAAPSYAFDVSAPSFDLAAYHVGARWRINERFRVSLLYAHYWYIERTTSQSITWPPTNLIGSGEANMLTVVLEGRIARGLGVR